ncbi:MAG: VRR-NUC domain-containing protein [Fusobacteriaceae bacterium]
MLEKDIVKKIKALLDKKYPGFYFKSHGSGYQRSGIPDIVGCHRGRMVAIEVKTPKTRNNVSPLQEKALRDIREAGGLAFVAWSPEMVDAVMETAFKQCKK